ncbi:Type I-E CRISPR-associated protein Cas5/CasD [Rhodovastum atsumiense]|uniref:Type I-E CRISPR-associated protein Cas5/CasD n=1 Tax=Rhodovastum atsumiense TaxID=504468 RepID=A0A5M6INK2_9PROT|nr:type I-E CRISPR-associated protein Cas5/CasD [Rhodovastum atsumiense]KAA5609832.1 type I-E CRISPR-associated protein Cas5/CasD [Rhodovastum atsumiense]CAH2603745.1 Type I-E CRISPR-associated protein Cas5/CasD [Rhodovastum atsumiense]
MEVLLLRLEAPLMAFGGPQIDAHGGTRDLPGLSLLIGLFGNALGWTHADSTRLQRLQARLAIAGALVRAGEVVTDYQTVDLGQPWMVNTGWTTRGQREERGKGEATRGTHIRLRQYLADAAVLVAARLDPDDEAPTLADLAAALAKPARPLFIGRKPCLPSTPIVRGMVTAPTLRAAVLAAVAEESDAEALVTVEWPAWEGWPGADPLAREPERVVDQRDWANQFHSGERTVFRARLPARQDDGL